MEDPTSKGYGLMKKAYLLALVASFFCTTGAGKEKAKEVTLKEAIDFALSHSPLIQASKASLDVFEAKLKQIEWLDYPHSSVRFSVSPMPAQRVSSDNLPYTDMSTWGVFLFTEINGVLPLYTFGRISALKKAMKFGVEATKAKADVARQEVIFRIKKGFLALALASESLEVIKEGRDYLDKAKKHLESLEENEDPEFDPVEKMQLRVFDTQVLGRELEAQRGVAMAKNSIKVSMGVAIEEEMGFETKGLEPIETKKDITLETLVDMGSANRAEIVALRTTILAKQAEVSAKKRAFFPTLSLFGGFRYGYSNVAERSYSPYSTLPLNTYSAYGGLVLEGDFEIGKKLGELDEAKASLREMKMQLSELESGVKLEVTKVFYEMQDAKRMVEAYKDAVEAARGWVIAKTDLYENDLCSMNDVVTALVQFFQTRMEYLKAVYDYNVAVYALERAVSESLSWEEE